MRYSLAYTYQLGLGCYVTAFPTLLVQTAYYHYHLIFRIGEILLMIRQDHVATGELLLTIQRNLCREQRIIR